MKFNELRVEMMNAYSLSMEAFSDNDYQKAYEEMLKASKVAKQLSEISKDLQDAKEYENLSKHYYSKAINYHSMMSDPKKKSIYEMDRPTQGFEDFIGLDEEKEYLKEEIIKPWKEHQFYQRNKNALMIYGPHGVGKTRFAHSLIKELHAKSYFIQPLKHFSMTDFPDVEYSFKNFFSTVEKEDNVVLFMESPVPYFSNGKDEFSKDTCNLFLRLFKNEMKRIRKKKLNILFVATTSSPDKISLKAYEAGLFDDLLRIRIPSFEIRHKMMERYFKEQPIEKEEIEYLVDKTDGFVTNDISRLVKDLIENQSFTRNDIDICLSSFKKEDVEEFEKHVEQFEKSIVL